ncbi:MAG: ABC transporter permease [Actinomycetota bacterium]|nr:ABC transporter permease [Actinomycetota bacterium]
MDFVLYLGKKFLLTVILLLGIALITFSLTKALPGDPALALVGERASPATIAAIRKQIGADKPFLVQYVDYVKMISRGELGRSYFTRREVLDELKQKFPNTMRLALLAMALALPAGLALGFLAAMQRGRPLGEALNSISIVGISVPVFFSGLLIMLFASLELKLFPPAGTGGTEFLILPAITLSLPSIATLSKVSRTSALEVMGLPFIKTARAKGISEFRVMAVHIFRNAIIPIVTVAGLDFGSYLNGAVLTETIFGWDGIGRYSVEGVMRRDYPVVLGTVLAGTVIFIVINMLVDIAYHVLDPRVRVYGR